MLITPHLIAYYPLEGNANDASGKGKDSTVHGASLTTGKFGQCYSFDGTDDYITLPNFATFGTYSFSLWVKSDGTNGIALGFGQYNHILLRDLGDGTFEFNHYNGTTQSILTASITAATWTHFVATRDTSNNTKLYKNGVLVDSGNIVGNYTTAYYGDFIGSFNTLIFFGGLIDQVQIYNKALSQSDIKRIMLGFHPLG